MYVLVRCVAGRRECACSTRRRVDRTRKGSGSVRRGGGEACGGRSALTTPMRLMYERRAFLLTAAVHPFLQRSLQVSAGECAFRSPVLGSVYSLVANHVVQGRVIFPAAGYLELASAAVCSSNTSTPVAGLQHVFFVRPFAVEMPGLHIECGVALGRFEVRSSDADADTPEGAAELHCSGAVAPSRSDDTWMHIDHASVRSYSCTHAADVSTLYATFDTSGLQYGPGYRTLENAWAGGVADSPGLDHST